MHPEARCNQCHIAMNAVNAVNAAHVPDRNSVPAEMLPRTSAQPAMQFCMAGHQRAKCNVSCANMISFVQ